MPDGEWISDLDAAGACAAVERLHAERVRAEFELFALAAHWADLHCGDALDGERARRGVRVRPGMERAKRAGAHGTPRVAEFAAAELGALQGMGHVAGDHLIRDAVNVRDRHPLLWAALDAGVGRVWQARKVAQLCAAAELSWEQAGWVDEQTTEYLGALPWGRFEALVVAKIAEADPAAAAERARAAALRRFVATGQSSEHGLKTLVARAAAGEVIFFVAMVDRIAQVLALHGDADPVDVRRSKAIGILADPARALALLHSATQITGPAVPAAPTTTPTTTPAARTPATIARAAARARRTKKTAWTGPAPGTARRPGPTATMRATAQMTARRAPATRAPRTRT